MALFTVLKHAAKGEKGRVPGRDDVIYLARGMDSLGSVVSGVLLIGHQQLPPGLPTQRELLKQGSKVRGLLASIQRAGGLPVRVILPQLYR